MLEQEAMYSDKGARLRQPNRTESPNEPLPTRYFTVPELMRLAGMTRKQVSYWDQIGLVKPMIRDAKAITGQPVYFYSSAEVIKALIVCELRRAGFTPRQVQLVARSFQAHGCDLLVSKSYLLTDGYSVYYASSDTEVVDVLKNHRQMLLLVPIHEQVAKLRGAA